MAINAVAAPSVPVARMERSGMREIFLRPGPRISARLRGRPSGLRHRCRNESLQIDIDQTTSGGRNPRAFWKGHLRLSLVTCPIELYPATKALTEIAESVVSRQPQRAA